MGFEARRRERKTASLLEATEGFDREVKWRGDADHPTVERPPAEDVRRVLPPDLELERTTEQVPPLDVTVHHVDRRRLQTGDEPSRVRRIVRGLTIRSAEIGVDAHADLDRVRGLERKSVAPLQVVRGEAKGAREPSPAEDHVSPGADDLVALGSDVAGDLPVDSPRDLGHGRHGQATRERQELAHHPNATVSPPGRPCQLPRRFIAPML